MMMGGGQWSSAVAARNVPNWKVLKTAGSLERSTDFELMHRGD